MPSPSQGDSVPDEVNVREAARLLGLHENTVRNMADDGRLPLKRKLPGSGFRRFSRADVLRMREEMWTTFPPETTIDGGDA